MAENNLMEKIVSLCKRRGFVYPSSEIYGGLSGVYDLGPLGAELVYNIKQLWWRRFVSGRDDMYGISSSSFMPEVVWRSSGHLEGFADPLVECPNCHRRWRLDQLEEGKSGKGHCPECDSLLDISQPKKFNLMFPLETGSNLAYLRPELAQGMFVNFKNILDSFHPSLPFGIAQIGRAYRNEIAPRDFLFRVREFDLAEFEYFVRENEWQEWFEYWKKEMWAWIEEVGIDKTKVHELAVPEKERAHYSKRTIDFEFDYPFGRKELYGLAYRTDYDLKQHLEASGVDLRYEDPESGEKFLPHVVEPTFGIGRTILAVLLSAYAEDELGGERRTFLKLVPALAPVKAAVFPLLRNKPQLIKKAREVYELLRTTNYGLRTIFDDNGNIGKRYRRQDEIGTPLCVTVDFQTLEDDMVTIRARDSGEQERVSVKEISQTIKNKLK